MMLFGRLIIFAGLSHLDSAKIKTENSIALLAFAEN